MIILNEENKRLFCEQVLDHIAKLNDLMTHGSGEGLKTAVLRKNRFANSLLAGSLKMLGLAEWSRTLTSFGNLLDKAAASTGCWDETLSQIVSEILETEEQVIEEMTGGESEDPDPDGGFSGVRQEIEVLIDEAYQDEGAPVVEESVRIETLIFGADRNDAVMPGLEPVKGDESISESWVTLPRSPAKNDSDKVVRDEFNTMTRLISALEKVDDKLNQYLAEPRGEAGIRDLELAFGESEFFLGLIENILRQLGGRNTKFRAKVSSQTVLDGVRDFTDLNNRMHGWSSNVELSTDSFSLERKAASGLASILESCIFDINRMYDDREDLDLSIKVDIKSEGSYVVATVSDNGTDFLSDSQVDRDDAVAYYKGLLEVRSIIRKWDGLLWVEPESGQAGRFRFTFPRTTVMTDYHLLSGSGNSFAVPSRSIEGAVDIKDIKNDEGSNRRYVIVSGKSVPVCRLDELAVEEMKNSSEGDKIVIIGLAEERIGIITSGPWHKTEGIVEQLVEGAWPSITRQSLHIGEKEYPVIDPELVLDRYGVIFQEEDSLEVAGSYVEDGDAVNI
ncbi:MAG: hypothetical protein JW814_06320 [Candidatus Krumholzibacteriota bacterium]|nr:hypothetical protein [Candidatus Krumholzibacteriota bacterium]